MKKSLQRIRGAVGIGLSWATAWAPVGALTGWATANFLGLPQGGVTASYTVLFGTLGLIGGTLFSTVLSLAEGRRSFGELSLPRFVAWGAVGGLLLGALAVSAGLPGAGFTTLGAVMAGAATLLGAGSAAGTLLIARAARNDTLPSDGAVARARVRGESVHERIATVE